MERCPHADKDAKPVFLGDRGFLLCKQCERFALQNRQIIHPEMAIVRLMKKWGAHTE
jgi:hypothetical protein